MPEQTSDTRLRNLTKNHNWSALEDELTSWVADIHLALETCDDFQTVLRLQGSLETLRKVLALKQVLADNEETEHTTEEHPNV